MEPPLLIWRPSDGRIRLANLAASEVVGLTLEELIQRSVFDFLELNPHAQVVAEAVAVGAIDRCSLGARDDDLAPRTRLITRSLELNGSRDAATTWAAQTGSGSDRPAWKTGCEAGPIALGHVDDQWRVVALSPDAGRVLGRVPSECIGVPLPELIRSDTTMCRPTSPASVRCRRGDGTEISVLTAPSIEPGRGAHTFALVGRPEPDAADRVAELEERLRRIAAEVEAAEVGGLGDHSHPPETDPRFAGLTGRQRAILDGLLQGKRVPRIAGDLFVSQSTVRNHLVALFKRFGVHSQADLLEALKHAALAGDPPVREGCGHK